MEWLKKHADTLTILGAFALCFYNLNQKVNAIDKDVAIIKTVMIMNHHMPAELAKHTEKK